MFGLLLCLAVCHTLAEPAITVNFNNNQCGSSGGGSGCPPAPPGPIGATTTTLIGIEGVTTVQQTNLGSAVAGATQWWGSECQQEDIPVVGLVHAGALDANIPAGLFTKADFARAVRFADQNTLVALKTTVGQLRRILTLSATLWGNTEVKGWAHLAGARADFLNDGTVTFEWVDVDGDNLDSDPVIIATNSYLANGGDGYPLNESDNFEVVCESAPKKELEILLEFSAVQNYIVDLDDDEDELDDGVRVLEPEQEIGQVVTTRLNGDRPSVRKEQTNLGHLIAESLRQAISENIVDCANTGAPVVGVINAGSIRRSVEVGLFDVIRLAQISPFNNEIVAYTTTGEDLEDFLQAGIDQRGDGGWLQIAGFSMEVGISCGPVDSCPGVNVREYSVSDEAVVVVAVPAFLAGGGDGFPNLDEQEGWSRLPLSTTVTTQQAVKAYVESNTPINTPSETSGEVTLFSGVLVGATPIELSGKDRLLVRSVQTGAGYVAAEALRVYAQQNAGSAGSAFIGLVNSGGIRADFTTGDIYQATVQGVLRFNNEIVVFSCSLGVFKSKILAQSGQQRSDGGWMQVSGATINWSTPLATCPEENNNNCIATVNTVEVLGGDSQPLTDGDTIVFAVSTFVADGGDGYPDMFTDNDFTLENQNGSSASTSFDFADANTEQDILSEYIGQNGIQEGDIASGLNAVTFN